MGALGADELPSIVQPNLLVPATIQRGIDAGELFRVGSVVRNGLGRIVTHLDEVPGIEEAQEAARRAAVRLNVKIAVPVVAVVVAGGFVIAKVKKRKKTGELEVVVPASVQQLDASLRAYLQAAGNGNLDVAIIDKLISDLDEVRADTEEGGVTVPFSLDQLETVFSLVIDHTRSLAEAYSIDLTELRGPEAAEDNKVIDLQRHLEAQKRIISAVA